MGSVGSKKRDQRHSNETSAETVVSRAVEDGLATKANVVPTICPEAAALNEAMAIKWSKYLPTTTGAEFLDEYQRSIDDMFRDLTPKGKISEVPTTVLVNYQPEASLVDKDLTGQASANRSQLSLDRMLLGTQQHLAEIMSVMFRWRKQQTIRCHQQSRCAMKCQLLASILEILILPVAARMSNKRMLAKQLFHKTTMPLLEVTNCPSPSPQLSPQAKPNMSVQQRLVAKTKMEISSMIRQEKKRSPPKCLVKSRTPACPRRRLSQWQSRSPLPPQQNHLGNPPPRAVLPVEQAPHLGNCPPSSLQLIKWNRYGCHTQ